MVRFFPSVRRFFTPLNTFLAIIALVMMACVPKYDKVKIRHWDDNQMIFSL